MALKIDAQIKKRFEELVAQSTGLGVNRGSGKNYAGRPFYAWASSAMNLLYGVFGKGSPHYEEFSAQMKSINGNFIDIEKLESFQGILMGAKSDVDGGHIFSVTGAITGEIFGDFVAAAKTALDEGHHAVAAVLACAALEDALKRFALAQGLDVSDKTMEDVVNALKGKGMVSGAQKGLLAAMPRIRNHAMHAEWDKITPQDAGSVIGFVEQFLLTHFP